MTTRKKENQIGTVFLSLRDSPSTSIISLLMKKKIPKLEAHCICVIDYVFFLYVLDMASVLDYHTHLPKKKGCTNGSSVFVLLRVSEDVGHGDVKGGTQHYKLGREEESVSACSVASWIFTRIFFKLVMVNDGAVMTIDDGREILFLVEYSNIRFD